MNIIKTRDNDKLSVEDVDSGIKVTGNLSTGRVDVKSTIARRESMFATHQKQIDILIEELRKYNEEVVAP